MSCWEGNVSGQTIEYQILLWGTLEGFYWRLVCFGSILNGNGWGGGQTWGGGFCGWFVCLFVLHNCVVE